MVKKKTKQALVILLIIAILLPIAYFGIFQQEILTGSTIPNGYYPQQLYVKQGLNSLYVASGTGGSCYVTSSNMIDCVCPIRNSGAGPSQGDVWNGYSPITYSYDNDQCSVSGVCSEQITYDSRQPPYTLPSDFNIPTVKKTTTQAGATFEYQEVVDRSLVTITIPPNVNLFEKQINNWDININSKQQLSVHLMAWVHRKNTDLYWDVSKDVQLNTGDNKVTLTLPNDLYVVSDPYELIIIPTYINPAEWIKSPTVFGASACGDSGSQPQMKVRRYIQLGAKQTQTFVIASQSPVIYKATKEEACKEFYVQSVNDPYACITVLASKGCAEVQKDGEILGCPSAYNPRTQQTVQWLCTASGRCEPPIAVAVGKKLDPIFQDTLLQLTKNENDFKLPSVPLRQLDINSNEIDWTKVRGFGIEGTADCITPLLEGQTSSCKGIEISLGTTPYLNLGVDTCKMLGTSPEQGYDVQKVPFKKEVKTVDGSLIKNGINVVYNCGQISVTKKYVLQQEECVSNSDCSSGFINQGTCTNYKCNYTQQTQQISQQPNATPSTSDQIKSYLTTQNIIIGLVIIGVIALLIVYKKKIFKGGKR